MIADLLKQCAAAHHLYETGELGGVFDEDWPMWYAAFLLENGLTRLVNPAPRQSDLSNFLSEVSKAHKLDGGEKDWNAYASAQLAAKYLKEKGQIDG